MCLFGSRENCDGWLQDSHPDRVTGWALSSTADVLRWLNDATASGTTRDGPGASDSRL